MRVNQQSVWQMIVCDLTFSFFCELYLQDLQPLKTLLNDRTKFNQPLDKACLNQNTNFPCTEYLK